jgi:plastocyanin
MNSPANERHRRTPEIDSPPASRWLLIAGSVLALALAACSGASGSPSATLVPPSPIPSTPVAAPSASSSAPASGGPVGSGTDVQLSAQGIQFSTKTLEAPAGKAFSIAFQNNDSGISHNVDIQDANNTSVFKGAVFAGVASQTYQVPALKAGTYSFICDVHPTIMTGTLTVK